MAKTAQVVNNSCARLAVIQQSWIRKITGAKQSKIPEDYRYCHTFSDFWDAYQKVFPQETQRSLGKDSGETNHMPRWNYTLRQKLARSVRKTLSFSKAEYMYYLVTRWFIVEYNLAITRNDVF
jgi:insertion element IS1 protein InsB